MEGDHSAFEALVDRYQSMVYNHCLKLTRDSEEAEDLTQEVFLQAFEKLSSFKGGSKFSTWLYRITQNIYLMRRRKGINHIESSTDNVETVSLLTPTPLINANCPEKQILEKETKQSIRSLLALLPQTYKNPLHLYYFEELSYQEISQRLNVKINTLKSHILRGKEILKRWIQNGGPEDE